MNDYGQILKRILATPTTVTIGDVDALREQFPAFTLPAAMFLKYGDMDTIDMQRKRELLDFVATNTPDSAYIQRYVDIDRNDWAGIYPPAVDSATPSTDSAITTFLNTFGSSSPAEEALIERLIFNPTPDYSQVLEQEEAADPNPSAPSVDLADEDSQMARIEAFIAHEHEAAASPQPAEETVHHHQPVHDPQPQSHADDSTLSESLAKIFIKQGRYERALEIITNLNLKYPKKSAYFADQMRFLQKLVKIEQFRTQKQQHSRL